MFKRKKDNLKLQWSPVYPNLPRRHKSLSKWKRFRCWLARGLFTLAAWVQPELDPRDMVAEDLAMSKGNNKRYDNLVKMATKTRTSDDPDPTKGKLANFNERYVDGKKV